MDILFTEEDRDLFAMSFYVFAVTDERAVALAESGASIKAILDFYKNRAYIDQDTSKQ